MSGIATAVIGSAVIGGVVSSRAASKAGKAQTDAAEMSTEEQRRQFDKVQELLSPYTKAGEGSLNAQQDLLGLNGPDKQKAAIEMIKESPEFATLTQQGEEGLLQNASATGGVRGGNTAGALAQFRPQLLSQLIESKFGKLGAITGLGQASAAGTAAAAQNTGNNISQLMTQAGQARAGTALAQGQAITGVTDSLGTLAMLKGMKVF